MNKVKELKIKLKLGQRVKTNKTEWPLILNKFFDEVVQ